MNLGAEKNYALVVDTTAVQMRLKLLVKNIIFNEPQAKTFERAKKLIREFCAKISNLEIRREFEVSLALSFRAWYQMFRARFSLLTGGANLNFRKGGEIAKELESKVLYHGLAANKNPQDYARQVRREFVKIVEDTADAEDVSATGSLRNRAEIHVRWQEFQGELDGLRHQGVRLAWASSHADASERCAPWQGRVYSLDGTSGIIDGHEFVPVEIAMRGTKGDGNGLFGYNCRHRLIPYHDRVQPPQDYTSGELKKERAIDQQQRRMERDIRKLKARALMLQGIDSNKSKEFFAKAKERTEEYEKFSRDNERAYYPYRTQIMRSEAKLIKRR